MSDEPKQPEVEEEELAPGAEANTEVSDAAPGEAVEDPSAEITRLEAELTEAKEQVLRTQAEMQNIQRRAQQEVEKAHKFGQEKLITELLSVVDNLERALDSAEESGSDNVQAIKEGVELTHKSLLDTLKQHNVEPVEPTGEPFDPQFHQAVTTVENPDVEPKTVMEVFQKGYTLNGRLVRPAMVVVSKAPGA